MIAEILRQMGNFNEEQVQLFESKIVYRELKKDEIVLPEGGVCSSVFYNLSGALYQFNYKADNELNVIDLHLDQEWFLNASSFFNQKPSDSCIKAFTDCSIFELSVFRLHELIAVSPVFLQLGKVLDQATGRVHFFDNLMTPLQKYQYVLDHRPDLIQQFPLKIIAAYLKITPETLSRVRDKLSKGKGRS